MVKDEELEYQEPLQPMEWLYDGDDVNPLED